MLTLLLASSSNITALKPPFDKKLVVGTICFHLVEGRLYSVEHGCVTLGYCNAFWDSTGDYAPNTEIFRVLLQIVASHW